MGRWHHERERMVRASGIPATILRPSGFMTNALDWLPTIREGGFVLDPVGPGHAAPIDPADTAGFRTETVRRLLGREPRTFADWCARNASAFRAETRLGVRGQGSHPRQAQLTGEEDSHVGAS
jgi:uncharacterized protein YbjT (DUF2867 family)